MKVAVTAQGKDLSSEVDPHFGRAPYFIVYDLETGAWEAVQNPAATEARGAGIAAASFLAQKGVDLVITGHCGPKAFSVLKAAGIKVAEFRGGTVEEAISAARAGKLAFLEAPSVDTHFGGGIPGLGKVVGGGMGRGCGGGGKGPGRGCGQGREKGGKCRRGRGS